MKDLKEKIEVMQAALDGEEIEYNHNGRGWEKPNIERLVWDWQKNDYRIKPEPMEFWMVISDTYGFQTKEKAEEALKLSFLSDKENRVAKMREVIE